MEWATHDPAVGQTRICKPRAQRNSAAKGKVSETHAHPKAYGDTERRRARHKGTMARPSQRSRGRCRYNGRAVAEAQAQRTI